MQKSVTILGISGGPASGKDTVADIISREFGHYHISSSDLLRQYITDNRLGELTRETMTNVANQLRAEKGEVYLVEHALRSARTANTVVSGIYSVAEASFIQSLGGAVLFVECSNLRMLYDRIKSRAATRDTLTFEEFKSARHTEDNNGTGKQNLNAVSELADWHIDNTGSVDSLRSTVRNLLSQYRSAGVI